MFSKTLLEKAIQSRREVEREREEIKIVFDLVSDCLGYLEEEEVLPEAFRFEHPVLRPSELWGYQGGLLSPQQVPMLRVSIGPDSLSVVVRRAGEAEIPSYQLEALRPYEVRCVRATLPDFWEALKEALPQGGDTLPALKEAVCRNAPGVLLDF